MLNGPLNVYPISARKAELFAVPGENETRWMRIDIRYIPQHALPVFPHFPLKLKHAVEKSLGGRRTAGDIDVDWDDA